MTARTIQMLLDHLPEDTGSLGPDHYQTGWTAHRDGPYDSGVEKFAVMYTDLAVGWKVARKLAALNMDFPAFVQGDDLVLRNAYLYCLDKDMYACPHVREARYLASNKSMGEALEGLLLCDDLDYEEIAFRMNVHPRTVLTYEKLFFNVVDRHMDHLFIRNVVYPHGRLAEAYENYLETEELGNLLKRMGFNNGKEDVLHFAGFRSGLLNSLATQNMPTKLEGVIMANGYLLARNGWANQREHAAGLISARNLIAAAKHGGQDTGTQSAFEDYGPTLMAELVEIKTTEATARPVLADRL